MITGSGVRVPDLGCMCHGLGFGGLGSGFRTFACGGWDYGIMGTTSRRACFAG